jgi:L-2,4-diaminobutyrate transaminase
MLRRGVIARAMPQGDILGFAPPLLPDEAKPTRSPAPPPKR